MTFADLSLLWLGSGLTALILVGVWSHARRRRRLAAFLGGGRALARISRRDLSGLRVGRALLLTLAGVALAAAAADPHWLEPNSPEPPPVDRVVLALDVSASMQATDASPTRLGRAAAVASELLAALEGHEVGLMLFAGKTYPLASPTRDHAALSFLLGGVSPTMVSAYDPGTLQSVAISDAAMLLQASPDPSASGGALGSEATGFVRGSPGPLAPSVPTGRARKRIVLIGDGDAGDSGDALSEALDAARAASIEVYTIGVGTERGSGMSLPAGTYQLGGPVTTASGARATSRLREPVLRDLASRGGGRYAHADVGGDLRALREALVTPPSPAETVVGDTRPLWARYDMPFLLGVTAIVLIMLESLLDTRLPRLPTLTREVA